MSSTLETTGPTYDDRGLYLTLIAATVLFVIAAPLCLYALDGVSVAQRLWTAFLGANLVAWTGLLGVALAREARRLAQFVSRNAGSTRVTDDQRAGGELALEG